MGGRGAHERRVGEGRGAEGGVRARAIVTRRASLSPIKRSTRGGRRRREERGEGGEEVGEDGGEGGGGGGEGDGRPQKEGEEEELEEKTPAFEDGRRHRHSFDDVSAFLFDGRWSLVAVRWLLTRSVAMRSNKGRKRERKVPKMKGCNGKLFQRLLAWACWRGGSRATLERHPSVNSTGVQGFAAAVHTLV